MASLWLAAGCGSPARFFDEGGEGAPVEGSLGFVDDSLQPAPALGLATVPAPTRLELAEVSVS